MSNEILKKLDVSQIDYKQKDVIVHRFISKYTEFSKGLENLDQRVWGCLISEKNFLRIEFSAEN